MQSLLKGLYRSCVAIGLLSAFLLIPACALRRPTVSRSHEASFGIGGAGHMLTGSEFSDEPRYGVGAALAWWILCALLEGDSAVCGEMPVDGIPAASIISPNPAAPRSYLTLALTPGLRFESNKLPGGFCRSTSSPLGSASLAMSRAICCSMAQPVSGTARPRPPFASILDCTCH